MITFVFAHRSIQEHLVADELLRPGRDGTKHLSTQATNLEWRQVIVFFTAAPDQALVSPFPRKLVQHNVVLAGACLARADCSTRVARCPS